MQGSFIWQPCFLQLFVRSLGALRAFSAKTGILMMYKLHRMYDYKNKVSIHSLSTCEFLTSPLNVLFSCLLADRLRNIWCHVVYLYGGACRTALEQEVPKGHLWSVCKAFKHLVHHECVMTVPMCWRRARTKTVSPSKRCFSLPPAPWTAINTVKGSSRKAALFAVKACALSWTAIGM